MIKFFKHIFLSSVVLCASSVLHAQDADKLVLDSVRVNQGGYAVLEKAPKASDVDFEMKSKLVRDAYRKREVRKQQDMSRLPAPSKTTADKNNGPLR